MHAIAYREVEVAVRRQHPPPSRTWYLITLEKLEWKPNPMWVHEGSSQLNLGF